MDGQVQMVLGLLAAMTAGGLLTVLLRRKSHSAFFAAVRRELKKEKQWLRRGEYNAAMVKGRQNLELLLKSVADEIGIEIDNTAPAPQNQKNNGRGGLKQGDRKGKNGKKGKQERGSGRRRLADTPMTNQQFCWWLGEKGYLDRVAKWELNQIRMIGNKAVHENFDSKDEAWNQYNYLTDILRTFSQQNWTRIERSRKNK